MQINLNDPLENILFSKRTIPCDILVIDEEQEFIIYIQLQNDNFKFSVPEIKNTVFISDLPDQLQNILENSINFN